MDSWSRDDFDANSGSPSVRSEKQRREGSRHSVGTWPGCDHHGGSFRCGVAFSLGQVLMNVMIRNSIFFNLLIHVAAFGAADRQWILEQSTLTYHVSHPLHQTEGVSRAARGKGVCHEGQCDFLIAVPVESFDSGDSNRDLHMIQVTRGAEFPMVTVRTRLPESAASSTTIKADLDIQFAGQTAHYSQVPLDVKTEGAEKHITGTI